MKWTTPKIINKNLQTKQSNGICVKCGCELKSCAYISQNIVQSSQIISPICEELDLIDAIELKKCFFLCQNCFISIGPKNGSNTTIEKYYDIQCDICLKRYETSMGDYSWEGLYCATKYCEKTKKFNSGYGSLYDGDYIDILSENTLHNHWENIDLLKPFIVYDKCLKYGLDQHFFATYRYICI